MARNILARVIPVKRVDDGNGLPAVDAPNITRVIEVDVYYHGGHDIFSGQTSNRRGYRLQVRPVTYEKADGYTLHSFMLFSGRAIFLEAATRFSQKTLDRVARGVVDNPPAELAGMIADVMTRNHLAPLEAATNV